MLQDWKAGHSRRSARLVVNSLGFDKARAADHVLYGRMMIESASIWANVSNYHTDTDAVQ